jgi:acyl-CoA hydrolase
VTASFFQLRLAVSPFETEGYRSMSQTSAQTVTMIEVVFPDQTNHYGTLFGGHALRLMHKTAFVAASRYARKTVVTVCSERVDFQAAVRHGRLIELTARVVATGRSSMTVGVDLVAEDLLSGDRQLDAQGRFVLVALDENQRPTAVPPVSASPNQLSANKGTV